MEAGKYIIIFLVFLYPAAVFAYDNVYTHPALTAEAVKFFNLSYPRLKLEQNALVSLQVGSREEDDGERSLKHFFDPVYHRGLTTLGWSFESAKDWSQDTLGQGGFVLGPDNYLAGTVTSYFSAKADYSWARAVYDYTYVSQQQGLEDLGHVLHLVQDMTVPDHVRNDPHLIYVKEVTFDLYNEDSPYEVFTAQAPGVNQLADQLWQNQKRPIIYSGLDDYFDTVAEFTNYNFFSKDTILDEEYPGPIYETEEYKGSNLFGVNSHLSANVYLVRIIIYTDKYGHLKKDYSLEDDDNLILNSYWSILSKQAVQNSAGVIKLFFDAVAEEVETGALARQNQSWVSKILAAVGMTAVPTPLAASVAVVTADQKDNTLSTETLADQSAAVIETQPTISPSEKINYNYWNDQIDYLRRELYNLELDLDPTADWAPPYDACP